MQVRNMLYLKRKSITLTVLMIAFVIYLSFSKYQGFQNNDSLLPNSTLAPDAIQQQVATAVGTIPGLQELFVSQLADGSYLVHGTVDASSGGSDDTVDESKQFQSTAFQFMNEVYGVKLPIKSAELYIVQNDRIVFGMGIGNQYKELISSITVSAGEDKQTPVIQTIQKINNQDESHPEQMAWMEVHS